MTEGPLPALCPTCNGDEIVTSLDGQSLGPCDCIQGPPAALVPHVLHSYDEDGDEYAEPCNCPKDYDHDEEGYRYES